MNLYWKHATVKQSQRLFFRHFFSLQYLNIELNTLNGNFNKPQWRFNQNSLNRMHEYETEMNNMACDACNINSFQVSIEAEYS